VGEVEKYKEAKKELETKLQIIERLQKGKMLVVQLLDRIGATIPEKMWLDELGLKGQKLSMEGYAVDNETIAAFMKELERTKSFRTVELLLTEQKDVEGVGMKHFSLMAPLAPPKTETEGNGAKKTTTGPAQGAKKSP
jgi:type IV pilus assembly protein PilN